MVFLKKDFFANQLRDAESIASRASSIQRKELYESHIADLRRDIPITKTVATFIPLEENLKSILEKAPQLLYKI